MTVNTMRNVQRELVCGLPDAIWLEIFGYLSTDSKKVVAKVCRAWKERAILAAFYSGLDPGRVYLSSKQFAEITSEFLHDPILTVSLACIYNAGCKYRLLVAHNFGGWLPDVFNILGGIQDVVQKKSQGDAYLDEATALVKPLLTYSDPLIFKFLARAAPDWRREEGQMAWDHLKRGEGRFKEHLSRLIQQTDWKKAAITGKALAMKSVLLQWQWTSAELSLAEEAEQKSDVDRCCLEFEKACQQLQDWGEMEGSRSGLRRLAQRKAPVDGLLSPRFF